MKYPSKIILFIVGLLVNSSVSSNNLSLDKILSDKQPYTKYVNNLATFLKLDIPIFSFISPPRQLQTKEIFENLTAMQSRPIDCLGEDDDPDDGTCFGTIENYERQLNLVLGEIDALGSGASLQIRSAAETLRFKLSLSDSHERELFMASRLRTAHDDDMRKLYYPLIKAIGEMGIASIILNQAHDMSRLTRTLIDLRKNRLGSEERSVEKAKVIKNVLDLVQTELEEIFAKRSTFAFGTISSREAFTGQNDASVRLRDSKSYLLQYSNKMSTLNA